MNIRRYVEPIDNEIPHDVEAHLLGGIPERNINDLEILQTFVPDILNRYLKIIRPGYLKLTKPVSELTNEILNDGRIIYRNTGMF